MKGSNARLAEWTSFLCDGARILQTLENLVGNAIKFVPRGGRILVVAEVEAGEVRFEIQDTGPGIAEAELARIFERHWTRGDGTGTGLGLYIARAVVEAHGGRIWAESEQGTTMAFTIPLRAVAASRRTPAGELSPRHERRLPG